MNLSDRLIRRFALATLVALPLSISTSKAQTATPAKSEKAEKTEIKAADAANARKWLEQYLAAEKGPDTKTRLLQGAVILHRIGAHPEALALMEKAAALTQNNRERKTIVFGYDRIEEYDKAASYAVASDVATSDTFMAIGAAQVDAKDAKAKTTLLKAQAKAPEIEDLRDRAEVVQAIAKAFLKAGLKAEAKTALLLARTVLEQDTATLFATKRFENQVKNAALMHDAGDSTGARAEAVKIEEKVLASPLVSNEKSLVLYQLATLYRRLGDTVKADALNTKALMQFGAIESTENRQDLLVRTLVQQAIAGQAEQAVARAKKAEENVPPVTKLLEIARELGLAGKSADSQTAFAAAQTEIASFTDSGAQLFYTINLASEMGAAGDRTGAVAVFKDAEKRIPAAAEGFKLGALWANWVLFSAPYDLDAATAHLGDVPEPLRVTVYRALAEAAVGVK